MTSSNGDIFRVTDHLCGEFTGPRWNSPHKGKWRGALMFSLICVSINGWVNNGVAGDLRRHRPHYDVIVMLMIKNRDPFILWSQHLGYQWPGEGKNQDITRHSVGLNFPFSGLEAEVSTVYQSVGDKRVSSPIPLTVLANVDHGYALCIMSLKRLSIICKSFNDLGICWLINHISYSWIGAMGLIYEVHCRSLKSGEACSVAINTLRSRQNGHHYANDIFKLIFVYCNCFVSIKDPRVY